jgi:hypothetical protein
VLVQVLLNLLVLQSLLLTLMILVLAQEGSLKKLKPLKKLKFLKMLWLLKMMKRKILTDLTLILTTQNDHCFDHACLVSAAGPSRLYADTLFTISSL